MSPFYELQWRTKPWFILLTVTISLFTDIFLYSFLVPVIPFLLKERLDLPQNLVQQYTSTLLAAYSGAVMLFALPAGWISDKVGSRRRPFIVGLLLLSVGNAMIAFGKTFTVLVMARLLQGMSAAIVWTVGIAMVQDTVGPAKLGNAIGLIFSITTSGELFAPSLGGILYETVGSIALFGVAAGLLSIDIIMRLTVADSMKNAMTLQHSRQDIVERDDNDDDESCNRTPPRETDALLLPKIHKGRYKIHGKPHSFLKSVPILYCFREPRLLAAMMLCMVQGSLVGLFDATVTIEVADIFGFSSLNAGILFTAMVIPYLGFSSLAGRGVDKYGTKIMATAGFGFLVPCLALLGLPSQELVSRSGNIATFSVVLFLNGIGLALVASPSFVEASDVISNFEEANPGFFGQNGPYAQLFGFNALCMFGGLTIGPLLSGMLRDAIGFTYMALVFAGISGVTSIVSYFAIGESTDELD